MTMLFDTSPDEPTRSRSRKQPQRAPAVSEQVAEKHASYMGALPPPPLGKLDGVHECDGPRCVAACHDIIAEEDGWWRLQCCFCGCTQWVPAIPGHLDPKEEAFVFHDGRFAGLTIDETVARPRGREYVEWAAKEHKRPFVRKSCQAWLDHSKTTA